MIEWLAGISAGFAFKPILEDLAKEGAKEGGKAFFGGFCKERLKQVLPGMDPWKAAIAKALKEFLAQFEQELIGCTEPEMSAGGYIRSLKEFTMLSEIRQILGDAILEPERSGDGVILARMWQSPPFEPVPNDFHWQKLYRRYQSAAKTILRESDELRRILDSQNLETIKEDTRRIAGLSPGFDLNKYRDGLLKRYANLRLESLETSGADHPPIQLWKIFVEQNVRDCQEFNPRAYELPKEHQRRLRDKGALERELAHEEMMRRWQAYFQQSTRPALEVLNDSAQRLFVVLGDPGSGKSVLLEYLALRWANLQTVRLAAEPIPLLIELKSYVENLDHNHCRDFVEYLDHGVGTAGHLDQYHIHAALERGDASLLLDGLDEVFNPQARQTVVADIVRYTTQYPPARIIVTSRIIGYQHQPLRDAGFRDFILQDFEPVQVETFIQRWHDLAYADEHDRTIKQARLKKAIENSAAIRELGANPLLLTMMALLNRHQELPRDRTELYEQSSRLLLQQWDASRALAEDPLLAGKSFDYKDKQAMLRAVAYRMQTNPEGLAGNIITADELENTLVRYLQSQGYHEPRSIADRLIRQLRERNFILCFLGDDLYAFVHRTFLEFFCAWAFVWKFEKDRSLDFEELLRVTVDAHWTEETWHEVLRLIAGRLATQFAGRLIESLLDKRDQGKQAKHIFLAANCLKDVRNHASLQELTTRLLSNLKDLINETRIEKEAAIKAQDFAAAAGLRDVEKQAKDARLQVFDSAASTCVDPAWLKHYALADEDKGVRLAAAQELGRKWQNHPGIQAILLKVRAWSHKDQNLQRSAVEELARDWKNDPDTLPWLKELARSNEAEAANLAAVHELAHGWKDDSDTLPWLKELARSNEAGAASLAAVQELAHGWKDNPDTLPWLKKLAHSNEAEAASLAAVQELAHGWKDDPDTLLILRKLALSSQAGAASLAAVVELARGWKNDPDTLPLLKELARSDEAGAARLAAVQELAHGWKDDPDTLPILKDLARSDEGRSARLAAVLELARGWKNDPDTLPLLELAGSNLVTAMRRQTVLELARGWKNDLDTFEWLQELVRSDEGEILQILVGDVQVHVNVQQDDDLRTFVFFKKLALKANCSELKT